jgi:aspartyl-tRNA(Asn)/glutamyl-tRNA(Gln) amidotransferase subunit C
MEIDDSLISKLERLSRLKLDEKERDSIKKDLNKILQMVETLQELDTTDVEPLVYVNQSRRPEREDIVANELTVEDSISNAPSKHEDGFFIVPKVIDK